MDSSSRSKIFYGYFVVAGCFVTLFVLWGMLLNTFPILLKPMGDDMGWGRGPIMIAMLMGALGTAVAAPIAGKMVDRFGARPVMIAGALLTGVLLLGGAYMINQLWHLWVTFFFGGFGTMTATLIPCSALVSNWFVERRGTAMGVAFSGTSIGGMITSPIINWIIMNFGWRAAFVTTGATLVVFVIPVVFFLIRSHPSDMGVEPYRGAAAETGDDGITWGVGVKEAFSEPAFWQIAAVMLIVGIVTGGVNNHCPAYLNDIGHSKTMAAYAWAAVMGAMSVGKLAIGRASDRFASQKMMAFACALLSLGILILPFSTPYSVVMIFAIIYGPACAAPLVLNPLLTSQNLGMKNFGAIFGILSIMGAVGGAAGPVAAGMYFDKTETYLPIFYVFVGLMLAAGVCSLFIKPVSLRDAIAAEVDEASE
jgi:MFS family permease